MLTSTSRYRDVLKDLKGLITIPLAQLPSVRPGLVVYCARTLPRRGERWYVGTLRDITEDGRAHVWICKCDRARKFDLADVRAVMAQ